MHYSAAGKRQSRKTKWVYAQGWFKLWAAAGSVIFTKLEDIAKGFTQANKNAAQMAPSEGIIIPKKSHAVFQGAHRQVKICFQKHLVLVIATCFSTCLVDSKILSNWILVKLVFVLYWCDDSPLAVTILSLTFPLSLLISFYLLDGLPGTETQNPRVHI